MRRLVDNLVTFLSAAYLVAVFFAIIYSFAMPTPTLNRTFQAGLLFVMADNHMLPAQVCTDFDVCKRELDAMLGSSMLGGSTPWAKNYPLLDGGRIWRVKNEREYTKVFETYFRAFKPAEEVRQRMPVTGIALIPVDMDRPFLPNDLGELMSGAD